MEERRAVIKVKDIILYGFVFVLNLLVGTIALMGKSAMDNLDTIKTIVSDINTTTQLNSQYIRNVDESAKRHEIEDKEKFKDIEKQIRDILSKR